VRPKEVEEITPTRAVQGATFRNDEEKYGAARAMDMSLSTECGAIGWLKLELGRSHLIRKILIYYWFYTNWYSSGGYCSESIANFKQCVDNDNNVDVSVYQGDVKQKSCGTLKLTYGLEQSDQIYTLICNTKGDTVKLSKDTGIIALFEIVIVGINSGTYYTYLKNLVLYII
jgi:hypothetical protein